MRWRRRKSLLNAFDPSRRAAARLGPKHGRCAAVKRSTIPATSGPSGPTMVSAMSSRCANSSRASMSSAAISTLLVFGSSAVPALPGATNTWPTFADCAHFHARACSRPPPPTINTFAGSDMSVTKMPHPGEHHRDAVLVGRRNDVRIAHRASGLDHRLDAELGNRIEPVAEGEKRVGGHRGRFHGQALVLGLHGGDFAADHAAHLAGADAERGSILDADDGVRLYVLRDAPRKQQVVEFRGARLAFGDHAQLLGRDHAIVASLNQ